MVDAVSFARVDGVTVLDPWRVEMGRAQSSLGIRCFGRCAGVGVTRKERLAQSRR